MDGSKQFIYEGTGEEQLAYENFTKLLEERKKDSDKNNPKYKSLNVVEYMPLLTFSEQILQCLKEDLISELVIISTTRNTKKDKPSMVIESRKKKLAGNLEKFPQCSFSMIVVEKINGKNRPHRWEWIKENHPNFDIFIDDDHGLMSSVMEKFADSSEKTYVMPDYKCNRHLQAKNLYHIEQEISDLTDEDFVKAAAEYKTKQANKSVLNKPAEVKSQSQVDKQEMPSKPSSNYPLWISLGIGGIAILGLIGYFLTRKEENKYK